MKDFNLLGKDYLSQAEAAHYFPTAVHSGTLFTFRGQEREMNKWFAIALLIPCTALAREESIAEMSARFRMFCNQQAKEHRAECHQAARDRVAVESARREADRAEKQRNARTYR